MFKLATVIVLVMAIGLLAHNARADPPEKPDPALRAIPVAIPTRSRNSQAVRKSCEAYLSLPSDARQSVDLKLQASGLKPASEPLATCDQRTGHAPDPSASKDVDYARLKQVLTEAGCERVQREARRLRSTLGVSSTYAKTLSAVDSMCTPAVSAPALQVEAGKLNITRESDAIAIDIDTPVSASIVALPQIDTSVLDNAVTSVMTASQIPTSASDGAATAPPAPASPPATTGGSFQTQLITALASVLSSRVNAELQAYGIQTIQHIACTEKLKPWLSHTCAFVSPTSDELPVTFGIGLRTALSQDVVDFPRTLVRETSNTGSTKQLLATLFAGSIASLVQSSDIYQVANLMVDLATDTPDHFTCTATANDKDCANVLRAIGDTGKLIKAMLEKPALDMLDDVNDDPNDITSTTAKTTVWKRVTSPPTSPPVSAPGSSDSLLLVADVKKARAAAEALYTATGDAKRALVKPLVAAIEIAIDQGLKVAGAPNYRLPDGLPELADAIANHDIQSIVASALTLVPELVPDLDARMLRLMSFASEMAQAKTSADMQTAIESVLAPIGSYRVKATYPMLSVTGLVGGAFGWEHLSGSQVVGGHNPSSRIVAPSALVGLDLTTPLHNPVIPNAGVFLSVLDLGSLMSYRLSADPIMVNSGTGETAANVTKTSNVGFTQVFAPGVMARLGIANTPLVLGFGVDWVPDARDVTPMAGGPNIQLSAYRWFFSLSVDVTLFPFHF